MESKVIFSGYDKEPIISVIDGIMEVVAGESCLTTEPPAVSTTSVTSKASQLFGYGIVSWLLTSSGGNVLGASSLLAFLAFYLESPLLPGVMAAVCESPIVVDIYTPPKTKSEGYYVGSWMGTDPVDGAQLQRSIVPVGNNGTILYTARNEASGACGSSAENGQVIGLVNPIEGKVDEDGTVTFSVNFTCYGDKKPKFSGVPVSLAPLSKNIIIETIAGYPNPIYLHRVSPDDAMEAPSKSISGEYYVGSWMGTDPVDGAQLQRSVVPVGNNGTILYTARNEASGACGSSAEKGQVIGLVNPIEGEVDEDGTVTFSVNFTCYGDKTPKFSGVPVSLAPL